MRPLTPKQITKHLKSHRDYPILEMLSMQRPEYVLEYAFPSGIAVLAGWNPKEAAYIIKTLRGKTMVAIESTQDADEAGRIIASLVRTYGREKFKPKLAAR